MRGIFDLIKGQPSLPTLAQILGLLYNTLESPPLTDQIKIHTALHFQEVQDLFPKDAGAYETAALFLQSPEGHNFVQVIQGGEGALKTRLKSKELKWVQCAGETVNLNAINPLVEALFMAERGHNIKLISPSRAKQKGLCRWCLPRSDAGPSRKFLHSEEAPKIAKPLIS